MCCWVTLLHPLFLNFSASIQGGWVLETLYYPYIRRFWKPFLSLMINNPCNSVWVCDTSNMELDVTEAHCYGTDTGKQYLSETRSQTMQTASYNLQSTLPNNCIVRLRVSLKNRLPLTWSTFHKSGRSAVSLQYIYRVLYLTTTLLTRAGRSTYSTVHPPT